MKKKVKLFHDPVRPISRPIRTNIFFFTYCLTFIEAQLNICTLYNEYNFDPRASGHS